MSDTTPTSPPSSLDALVPLPETGALTTPFAATAPPAAAQPSDAGAAQGGGPAQGWLQGETTEASFENRLAMVRLGMATALYYALRAKHPPTAAHSLRVALGCSAWAQRMGLPEAEQDRIEVAALLHDIGKIGIPDPILKKPGKLSVEEQLTMDLCPALSCEILRGCTDDAELLDIVRHSQTWFDSRREGEHPQGDALPLGARMLAIAGAFDAITTDHVYRPAMSRERALAELLRCAGSQFDPELTRDYCRLVETRPEVLHGAIVNRWLQQLRGAETDSRWSRQTGIAASHAGSPPVEPFYRQLMTNLSDGVIFLDREGLVTGWNRALERLTGISADAVLGNRWHPELVRMSDERGTPIEEGACPLQRSLVTGVHSGHHLRIVDAAGETLQVHLHAGPVADTRPGISGVVGILHDATRQRSLEQRLQDLHTLAMQDPLTGVANRAEFDRHLRELTELASEGNFTFSLIICDIDHFKPVNDRHGHQAGDEALINFATTLRTHSREGDLVARYGGEEFVILCPACDNASAARRAETVRGAIAATPLPMLGGQSVTASFGVTEYQEGDRAETVLSRADRGLLIAKDNGRNRVVQLGGGRGDSTPVRINSGSGWLGWLQGAKGDGTTVARILTPVPGDLAIEKIRGFVADHQAEVIRVDADHVELNLQVAFTTRGRRRSDFTIAFHVLLTLEQVSPAETAGPQRGFATQTLVHISLRPARNRDRRRRDLNDGVSKVLASLRCYLMGELQ